MSPECIECTKLEFELVLGALCVCPCPCPSTNPSPDPDPEPDPGAGEPPPVPPPKSLFVLNRFVVLGLLIGH